MITVISLGGSLIYPRKPDIIFMEKFCHVISEHVEKGHKFVVYCGGGHLARKRQKRFSFLMSKYLLDWIGILATRENAQMIKQHFNRVRVHKEIITNPTLKVKFTGDIIVAAGWKPGWSTDYDAVLLARNLKAKKIINLTNVDYAYTKDPKKYEDAKPIKRITWKNFRKLVGDKWKPGLNMPFDPVAARAAERFKMSVILAGNDLKNLKNIIENKKFKGTRIR